MWDGKIKKKKGIKRKKFSFVVGINFKMSIAYLLTWNPIMTNNVLHYNSTLNTEDKMVE